MRLRSRRLRRLLLGVGAVAVCSVVGFLWALHRPLPIPEAPDSTRFLDRNGEWLSARSVPERAFGAWTASFDQWIIQAFLAAEDHRFYDHMGIDPRGIGRASAANIEAGEAVQGASTITQQLARRLWPRQSGWWGKLSEAWGALRLEATLDKDRILVEYLNRIYFGNHAYGVDAAVRTYLDKSVDSLSIAEAALIAALPRAPEALDPWEHPDEARAARNRVIQRMQDLGWIDSIEADAARAQPLGLRQSPEWSRAPHLVRRIETRPGEVRTTLDVSLQVAVQAIIDQELERLSDHEVDHAAVVVLDNQTAEVRAYVGSADWGASDGQVDGAMAPRSPGSALKPFAYWMALEDGLDPGGITLATVLSDLPGSWNSSHGSWSPSNYDDQFHGPIRAREALARSLNLPAVRVLERVGTPDLQRRLQDLGLTTLDQRPAHYGLGLALGDAEVRLDELTAAYLALGSHGLYRAPRWLPEEAGEAVQVGHATSAWLVLNALDDPDARAGSFMIDSPLEPPFPMAAKTGTSVGFRDNWALGITGTHTIGVWVGNFDAEPMKQLSGVSGAGPILRRVSAHLADTSGIEELAASPEPVDEARICLLSGMRQSEVCPGGRTEAFVRGTAPEDECSWHRHIEVDTEGALATGCPGAMTRLAVAWPGTFVDWAREHDELGWPSLDRSCVPTPPEGLPDPGTTHGILWPPDGSVFYLDPRDPPERQAISLRASLPHGSPPAQWRVDGRSIGVAASPYQIRWVPEEGAHTITLLVEGEVRDEVEVWVGGSEP
jgi:penicillin-binding protein 1C